MFHICDEQGRVVAFSGRVLKPDEKSAKYVNSPETPIFTKSKVFYGLDKSKRALLDAQFAVVCEGQLDLIACYMAGVRNVVAPQGTAFTSDHARILKRYVGEVVLCFDSDTAGQNAAVRVLDSLVASGLAIRVATVPAPHDPDSFIKEQGGPAFAKLISDAPGFFDYYLDRLCATHDLRTDRGQVTIVRAMADALQKTGSNVLLDKYAQKTALRLAVSTDAVRAEFKTLSRRAQAGTATEPEPADTPCAPPKPPPNHELWLLKIILLHDDLADWSRTHLDLSWLDHPGVRRVVSLWMASVGSTTWSGPATLLPELGDDPIANRISQLLADARRVPNPRQQLEDITLRLRNQAIEREMDALRQRSASPDLPESESRQIAARFLELKSAKAAPLVSQPEGEGEA